MKIKKTKNKKQVVLLNKLINKRPRNRGTPFTHIHIFTCVRFRRTKLKSREPHVTTKGQNYFPRIYQTKPRIKRDCMTAQHWQWVWVSFNGLQRLGLLQLHLGGRPTFYPQQYVKFIFYKSDHAYEFPTKNYFHTSIKKILW